MKHPITIVLILFFMFSISCTVTGPDENYKMVYKNDKQGNPIVGSKDDLIQSIRGGASIRIGWGTRGNNHSIEHLSDPIWIAVIDETEVIAHLAPQVLSKIDWNDKTATYADSSLLSEEWRVVLTTKGEFDAVWYDRDQKKVIKRVPQNHTISWFAKGGVEGAGPLFEIDEM